MVSILVLRSRYFLNAVRKSLLADLLPSEGLGGLPMSPPELGVLVVPEDMVWVVDCVAAAGVVLVGTVPPCETVLMIAGRMGGVGVNV